MGMRVAEGDGERDAAPLTCGACSATLHIEDVDAQALSARCRRCGWSFSGVGSPYRCAPFIVDDAPRCDEPLVQDQSPVSRALSPTDVEGLEVYKPTGRRRMHIAYVPEPRRRYGKRTLAGALLLVATSAIFFAMESYQAVTFTLVMAILHGCVAFRLLCRPHRLVVSDGCLEWRSPVLAVRRSVPVLGIRRVWMHHARKNEHDRFWLFAELTGGGECILLDHLPKWSIAKLILEQLGNAVESESGRLPRCAQAAAGDAATG